ncbi:MAG: hypothetical protein R3D84_07965 [Paracoccaceae bacterium]
MSDGLWGLVDGVNDAGLVVSLTFGGRREVGEGVRRALDPALLSCKPAKPRKRPAALERRLPAT